jgi:ERCC4-related helicase
MINQIQKYLSKQKDQYNKLETDLSHTMLTTDYHGENVTTYHTQSSEYTSFTQSQSITLLNLKRYLENLIEVGRELGLLGLFLFAKELRRKLKINQTHFFITNTTARELFEDIFQRFECLVDDILKNLHLSNLDDLEILSSPKVIKLIERIIKQQNIKESLGRCIVFVERVYTATILSNVLSNLISSLESPWDTRLKVKHITGIKAIFSDKPMTVKYQVRIFLD